jgi:hypothetical protein
MKSHPSLVYHNYLQEIHYSGGSLGMLTGLRWLPLPLGYQVGLQEGWTSGDSTGQLCHAPSKI